MKILASIGSPLYQEVKIYGKNKTVRCIKEGCKKNLLLSVSIEGVSENIARMVFSRIMAEFSTLMGNTEVKLLSEYEWGNPATYDMEALTLYENICVPKEFDNLEEQKNILLKKMRDVIRGIKREYKRIRFVDNMEQMPIFSFFKEKNL